MSVMDRGEILVILAGYSEPMKRVISSNKGFSRRVTKFFDFNDFSSEEIAQIVHLKMNKQAEESHMYGFKLHPSCSVDAITKLIEVETTEEQRNIMNGGVADQLLVNARENFDEVLDCDIIKVDDILTITLKDLERGLRSLNRCKK
ncbi:hypothetical protein IFM89_000224 [Coptis chinensis]|uniref:Uncharacterized protein n=1 Tax=Coptis chinensis TaxID=261450 RepID=A0A835M6H0_9MAGN|nr:hypothetical protein IFM89_000224 [Coptis chinensis]